MRELFYLLELLSRDESKLNEILNQLKEKERIAFSLRWGLPLNDKRLPHLTLRAIGDILGCSAERARQLEYSAYKNLAHPRLKRQILAILGLECVPNELNLNELVLEYDFKKKLGIKSRSIFQKRILCSDYAPSYISLLGLRFYQPQEVEAVVAWYVQKYKISRIKQ
ncbi:sigma factor-like helix-turn-helix DNA-binding protein [Campylobacter sp. FOBRC14]|uniref:sigma factor-like helix-turn-helix DNA-binding protein n=1 Tax=Campylobacter sp. FOBRC14 TaxID=936554 RepID=UPI00027A3855|nr:sigma factor-like helix-turn-helix DNA-binding protein [Campylobacter sp. FOBRC14]EJP74669.1 sigma-70, region 4 [Campylobacter sp. FOBRC14]